jgi:FkbM family methyltransferase
VRHCALGDAASELKINIFRDTSLSSLHAANAAGQERFPDYFQLDRTETVSVLPLDDLIATLRLDAPEAWIFLKTDTQGHDLAVLQGARTVLAHSLAVMTEASIKPIYQAAPAYGEIIRYLNDAGFSLSGIYPLAHNESDMSLIEVDCCFVRPGASLPR